MYSRWYNIAVVFLWLLAMGWLVIGRVVPDWLVGEPPDYPRILDAQKEEPTVGWHLTCNGRPLGWSLTRMIALPSDLAEIESHVRFEDLRALQSKSLLAGALQRLIFGEQAITVDAHSTVRIDSLGNLLDFDSSLWNGRERLVRLRGQADGGKLVLTVSVGSYFKPLEETFPLPPRAVMGDALSPQTHLPGLRIGQTWTAPVYNPMMPSQPLEVLHAEVEGSEPFLWEDGTIMVWLVVYRGEHDRGGARGRAARGRLWVHPDGAVLKQEASLLDATLTFTRMTRAETEELEKGTDPNWSPAR